MPYSPYQAGRCETRPQSVNPQAEEMLCQIIIKSQNMSGVALMKV